MLVRCLGPLAGAPPSAHRKDEVGQVAFLCNDLKPGYRLAIANDILDQLRAVLLNLHSDLLQAVGCRRDLFASPSVLASQRPLPKAAPVLSCLC